MSLSLTKDYRPVPVFVLFDNIASKYLREQDGVFLFASLAGEPYPDPTDYASEAEATNAALRCGGDVRIMRMAHWVK